MERFSVASQQPSTPTYMHGRKEESRTQDLSLSADSHQDPEQQDQAETPACWPMDKLMRICSGVRYLLIPKATWFHRFFV